MDRLTQLLFSRVLTSDGKCVGHVSDLQCRTASGRCEVEEIVYGERAFFHVLGLGHRQPKAVPWSAVERLENGRVILRAGAHDRARTV